MANLGAMTFQPAAVNLDMPVLLITSNNTRDYADYTLTLQPTVDAAFTLFRIDFQDGYEIAELWSEKKLVNSLTTATRDVVPVKNSFNFNGTYSVTKG